MLSARRLLIKYAVVNCVGIFMWGKIKTTAPAKYAVRPTTGILTAGQMVDVQGECAMSLEVTGVDVS